MSQFRVLPKILLQYFDINLKVCLQRCVLVFWCVGILSYCPPVLSALPIGIAPLENRLSVEDVGAQLSLFNVIQTLEETEPLPDLMSSNRWHAQSPGVWPQMGMQKTLWYRFGLENASSATSMLMMELPNRWIQSAHLFTFDHGQQKYRAVLGEPAGEAGTFALGKLAFPLLLEPGAKVDVYLRIEGVPLRANSIKLLPKRSFMQGERQVSLSTGIVMGASLSLVLLGCLAAYWLRSREFVWLSAYGLMIGFFLLMSSGFDAQLLGGWLVSRQQSLGALVALIPYCFLGELIRHRLAESIARRFAQVLLASSGLAFMLCWFMPALAYHGLIPLLVPMICISALVLGKRFGLSMHRRGQRFFYLALAWLGGASLVAFSSSMTMANNAFLVMAIAWLGHLAFILFAQIDAQRGQAVSQYRQRLRRITEMHQREKLEHELLYQTMYDPLTGCPNRIAILHRLENMVKEDPEKEICVCLVYLDRFKEINNTLGHHNGDELLKRVARRLSGLAMQLPGIVNLELKDDKCAPLAAIDGVVFGLLLHDLSPEMLQAAAEQILRSLSYPFEFKKMTLDITAFIGIASYPAHGKGASELLQHAYVAVELAQQQDAAMLYYTQELDPYSARRLTLVGELKHALRTNGLEIFYQPQLDVKQNKVIGVEALIRWDHPEHGFISPAEFIPVAEKTGVIKQLTAWVLDRAIQDAAYWYEQGILMRVSVNLSAKNLQEADLPDQVISLLQKYNLPSEAIGLEITETAMMLDPARALRIITQLHDYGIRLSVDDFGTGYSSLAYLKQLPVAEIKIDRSFVGEMCRNTDDQVIVNTTLNMSHNLGLEVVAEGVEDERTLVALKRLGCDVAQGYFIGKPMRLSSVEQWMESSSHSVIRIEDENDNRVAS